MSTPTSRGTPADTSASSSLRFDGDTGCSQEFAGFGPPCSDPLCEACHPVTVEIVEITPDTCWIDPDCRCADAPEVRPNPYEGCSIYFEHGFCTCSTGVTGGVCSL